MEQRVVYDGNSDLGSSLLPCITYFCLCGTQLGEKMANMLDEWLVSFGKNKNDIYLLYPNW